MTISKCATQKIRKFTLHLDEIKAIKIFLAPLNEITTQKSHEFFFLSSYSLYKTKTKVDENRERKKTIYVIVDVYCEDLDCKLAKVTHTLI